MSSQIFWENLEQKIEFYNSLRNESRKNPILYHNGQKTTDLSQDYYNKMKKLLRMKQFYDIFIFKKYPASAVKIR